MEKIIFLFLAIFLSLIGLIGLRLIHKGYRENDIDKQYFDEEKRHTYYERSLIEKEEFHKSNPGVKGVRTIRALFSKRNKINSES